jgi:hypothetical protein
VNTDYPATAFRAEHRCEYCRAPEAAFNFPFDVEHIHPISAGGPGGSANLALGCRSCNLFKSAATTAADPSTGEIVPLFHPRSDRWEEHFNIQNDGTIVGMTANSPGDDRKAANELATATRGTAALDDLENLPRLAPVTSRVGVRCSRMSGRIDRFRQTSARSDAGRPSENRMRGTQSEAVRVRTSRHRRPDR